MPAPAPFELTRRDPRYAVVEIFGGDNNLAAYIPRDLKEALDGMGDDGSMLALIDHLSRPTEVIEITRKRARRVEAPGEIDTGDPETLAAFLARAFVSYGAETPIALGFWDHGTGVFDENDDNEYTVAVHAPTTHFLDPPKRLKSARRLFGRNVTHLLHAEAMLHDDTNSGILTTREAGSVVSAALKRAERGKLAAIFSDTCLNGMVEVLTEFGAATDYVIGSQALEPGTGWDYRRFLSAVRAPFDGHAFSRAAVAGYEDCYQTRTDLHPCTLGAFATDRDIAARFKGLIEAAVGDESFTRLDAARGATTCFDDRDSYDLVEFAGLVATDAPGPLASAARALEQSVIAARVSSVALGASVAGAQGLSFWFPRSRDAFEKTRPFYSRLKFDRAAGWTNYLNRHR